MRIDRVFLVSFLASLLINTALFGFLFRFKPPETVKTISVNISLEEDLKPTLSPERGKEKLLRKKSEKTDSSHKNRHSFPKKIEREPESKKKFKIHRRELRKSRVKRENTFENPIKSENRVNQRENFQKVLSGVGRNSRPVKEEKGDAKKASELESESGNKEKGSSPPLHKEETAGEKTENSNSGGMAGASQEARENGNNRAGKKESEDYLKLIIREVEKNKFYPLIARRMGIEGKVKLKIVIGKGGELLSVSVLSSDSEILKRAAVKTLKKCHFPPPPGGKFETELTIHYKLK